MRESGMPPLETWESFFDAEAILDALQLDATRHEVVEFGCGYGTFTVPAARRIDGKIFALDIDPDMIDATRRRAAEAGVENVESRQRDFLSGGSGLADSSVDYAMLFNILHGDDPLGLLAEVRRNLCPGGRLGIMHWNYDETTPRGPPMDIRPRPEQCQAWALEAGFSRGSDLIRLPPYHYGFVMID